MRLKLILNVDTIVALKEEFDGNVLGERTFYSDFAGNRVARRRRVTVTGTWPKRHLNALSLPHKGALQAEGSIGPYYSGQNAFTSSNVPGSVLAMYKAINRQCPLDLSDQQKRDFAEGKKLRLTRLDFAINAIVPSAVSKQAVLIAMAESLLRSGRPVSAYGYGETVYYNQHSQSATLKAYDKEREVKANNGVPEDLPFRERFTKLLRPIIRLELTLREPRLSAQGRSAPDSWTCKLMKQAIEQELNAIDMRKRVSPMLARNDVMRLKPQYRTTYLAWERGDHLRAIMDPKSLRRQADYFKPFRVDLYSPPPETTSLKVALGDIFSFDNALECPEWLHSSDLYFNP